MKKIWAGTTYNKRGKPIRVTVYRKANGKKVTKVRKNPKRFS